ncbi:amidase 1-like [Vicia villosa]|uniref:amidase 1-like n=1 Tax=Vicia villosa TaxID=3911 RepID=UPI00273C5454|nr:amidase 1-like [Vicia villosa]
MVHLPQILSLIDLCKFSTIMDSDYGAFVEKFNLHLDSSPSLPLNSLTFSVKDMFDVKGFVVGYGCPEWAKTHQVATSTAPSVITLLQAGAICIGSNVTDVLAYSINGENIHFGTPRNPCVPDRIPGGSSSGSAVAVAAKLVDFSLGTDCIGSMRIPASYCGIFGIRPSHNAIPRTGVTPMAPSLDTPGWFARDASILSRVGHVLLNLPKVTPVRPTKVIIADDCFQLSSIPYDAVTQAIIKAIEKLYGGDVLKHEKIDDYIKANVASLNHFISEENKDSQHNVPALAALTNAMQTIAKYEFKKTHGEWIDEVKPNLGPGVTEMVGAALKSTGENVDVAYSVKGEWRDALTALLGDFGVIMLPTVSGPPPKLKTSPSELKEFNEKAFMLQTIAGLSGGCQISIPLGMYDNLPISISLVAKHGADGFLLSLVESICDSMKE